jgi:hypothetical protein
VARRCRRCPLWYRGRGPASRRNCAAAITSATAWQGRLDCEQREGQGAARQVFGAMAIHSWQPPGSSSAEGDLLRRAFGRVGPDCSTSFRRRDRGLRTVPFPLSASVLTRTVERQSSQAFARRDWLSGSRAGGTGSPARPAAAPRPPARHSARQEQPAGRATGHRGSSFW